MLKILRKLRTASFNSEFTGSYKKSVTGFGCYSTLRRWVYAKCRSGL